MSSTPNASAVRNGEVSALNSSSISFSRAVGVGSLLDLAAESRGAPPSIGREPHSAEGHAILRLRPSLLVVAMPAMP